MLLDAAHNPAGAAALASYLREVWPEGPPLVFGIMRDKDVDGMLAALAAGRVATDHRRRRPTGARAAERLAALRRRPRAARPVIAPSRGSRRDPVHALDRALDAAGLPCVSPDRFSWSAALRERLVARAAVPAPPPRAMTRAVPGVLSVCLLAGLRARGRPHSCARDAQPPRSAADGRRRRRCPRPGRLRLPGATAQALPLNQAPRPGRASRWPALPPERATSKASSSANRSEVLRPIRSTTTPTRAA